MVDVGEDRGFDAGGDTNLHHEVGEVRLDSTFSDGQLPTDCSIWCGLPEEDEGLALTGRQVRDSTGVSWREGARRALDTLYEYIVDARVIPGQSSYGFRFLCRGTAWHEFPLDGPLPAARLAGLGVPHRRGGRMCEQVGCPTPPGWGNRPDNSKSTRRRVV